MLRLRKSGSERYKSERIIVIFLFYIISESNSVHHLNFEFYDHLENKIKKIFVSSNSQTNKLHKNNKKITKSLNINGDKEDFRKKGHFGLMV